MFKLALTQIKNNKSYKKIIIMSVISMVIIMTLFSVFRIFNDLARNVINNNYSLVSCTSNIYNESIQEKFDFPYITDVREHKLIEVDTEDMRIKSDSFSFDFEVPFRMIECVNDSDLLSNNELVEYQSLTNSDIIKYGRNIEKNNEILISESIIPSKLNKKDLIGVKVDLINVYWSKTEIDVLTNCEIVGIIDKNIEKVALSCGSIYVCGNFEKYNYITKIDFDDYNNIEKGVNEINKISSLKYESCDSFISYGLEEVEKYTNCFINAFYIFSFILLLAILVYIYASLFITINKNNNYNRILYSSGYSKLQIGILNSIVIILIFIFSFIFVFLIMLTILNIFNHFILKYEGVILYRMNEMVLCYFIIFIIMLIVNVTMAILINKNTKY